MTHESVREIIEAFRKREAPFTQHGDLEDLEKYIVEFHEEKTKVDLDEACRADFSAGAEDEHNSMSVMIQEALATVERKLPVEFSKSVVNIFRSEGL